MTLSPSAAIRRLLAGRRTQIDRKLIAEPPMAGRAHCHRPAGFISPDRPIKLTAPFSPIKIRAEVKAKAQASIDDLAPSLLKVKEFNRKLAAEIITRLEKTAVDDSALIPFYIDNSERAELGAISQKRIQASVAAGKITAQALDELKAKLLIVGR